MIPVLRPVYGPEEARAVAEVLRSGWTGLGPKTAEFEEAFARYTGASYVIGTNSATSALLLTLREVFRHTPAREVIVPSLTFVSTAHAVVLAGGTPVFADIEAETGCLDPESVVYRASARTAAVVPVHYTGHPCRLDALRRVLDGIKPSIGIIEDAAHACGAKYQGRRVGGISPLTCFSFHAVKNLSMGEGGAIAVRDEDPAIVQRFRKDRWLGISRDTYSRAKAARGYDWAYSVESVGLKAHLSDIAAAIGLVQLRKLGRMNRRRRQIAKTYAQHLSDVPGLILPVERPDCRSAWHLYVIRVQDPRRRDPLIRHLQSRGVGVGMHYRPLHTHPCYHGAYSGYRGDSLPVTVAFAERALSLPIHLALSHSAQETVIHAIREFFHA